MTNSPTFMSVFGKVVMTLIQDREDTGHPIELVFDEKQKTKADSFLYYAKRDVSEGNFQGAIELMLELLVGLVLLQKSKSKDHVINVDSSNTLFMDILVAKIFLGCENEDAPMPNLNTIFDVAQNEMRHWKMLMMESESEVDIETKMDLAVRDIIISYSKLEYKDAIHTPEDVFLLSHQSIMDGDEPHEDDEVWDKFVQRWRHLVGDRILDHEFAGKKRRQDDNLPDFTFDFVDERYTRTRC